MPLEFSFQEFGRDSVLANIARDSPATGVAKIEELSQISVQKFAGHPALASIATYSPSSLARLINGAYRCLSRRTTYACQGGPGMIDKTKIICLPKSYKWED